MQNKIDNTNNRKLSVLCVIMAGCLWGMMGLFVRNLAADGLSSLEIVVLRSIGSTVLMAIILVVMDLINRKKSLRREAHAENEVYAGHVGRDGNSENVGYSSLFRIRIEDIWCFIGTGIVSLTFFNLCYFTTIQMTSMAVAAILMYTSPIFVVIFSAIFFGERITGSKIVALVLAFAGCALVTGIISAGDGMVMPIKGILIGIGSGVGYALYSIFGRFAIERGYRSETITFYTFLLAAIGICIVSPYLCPIPEIVTKLVNGNTGRDILLILGQSFLVTVLPYLLYTKGLNGLENGMAGIIASVEPVVAAILGMLVYGERLAVSGYMGVLLVLGAIVILNLPQKKTDITIDSSK